MQLQAVGRPDLRTGLDAIVDRPDQALLEHVDSLHRPAPSQLTVAAAFSTGMAAVSHD